MMIPHRRLSCTATKSYLPSLTSFVNESVVSQTRRGESSFSPKKRLENEKIQQEISVFKRVYSLPFLCRLSRESLVVFVFSLSFSMPELSFVLITLSHGDSKRRCSCERRRHKNHAYLCAPWHYLHILFCLFFLFRLKNVFSFPFDVIRQVVSNWITSSWESESWKEIQSAKEFLSFRLWMHDIAQEEEENVCIERKSRKKDMIRMTWMSFEVKDVSFLSTMRQLPLLESLGHHQWDCEACVFGDIFQFIIRMERH